MLLDEPLSNLDAKLRTQMRSEIVKLHKKLQTTFIYVTHDQVEAMTMGTRIVVMKDGYVKQIDTPKNLYKYPANKFVAGFIGTPQMNFFEGTLKKTGDKVKITLKDMNAQITVPYSRLSKTTPQYLDGSKAVIIGFRAEDITLDKEKVSGSGAKIKGRISHSEELGTETLVYGEIENGARVIIKAGGFKEYEPDTVMEAALNMDAIHLFDAETEESIMPRIPEYNYVDSEVKNGEITLLGNKLSLPPAIKSGNGKCELLIPVSAVTFDGDIKASVAECEDINGRILVTLEINGGRLYALSDKELKGNVSVGIDFTKITLKAGGEEVTPMPAVNGVNGTFIAEKAEGGKVYSLLINGARFAAPAEIYEKMFAATTGRKVYNSCFRYEWSPYDIKIGDAGLEAVVEETLDYGREKFAVCKLGENTAYVYSKDGETAGLKLMPAVDKLAIYHKEKHIRII